MAREPSRSERALAGSWAAAQELRSSYHTEEALLLGIYVYIYIELYDDNFN